MPFEIMIVLFIGTDCGPSDLCHAALVSPANRPRATLVSSEAPGQARGVLPSSTAVPRRDSPKEP
jgi:hypothetical protein